MLQERTKQILRLAAARPHKDSVPPADVSQGGVNGDYLLLPMIRHRMTGYLPDFEDPYASRISLSFSTISLWYGIIQETGIDGAVKGGQEALNLAGQDDQMCEEKKSRALPQDSASDGEFV